MGSVAAPACSPGQDRDVWLGSRMKDKKVVVCGGGGFIGGHLVGDLLRQGFTDVRSVDVKPFGEWYQQHPDAENLPLDLNLRDACYQALKGAEGGVVYNL